MWCTGILIGMARARTPEGKRVVIPVRVSEPMAAELDKARGDLDRSAWVRGVLSAYLAAAASGQADTVPELEHGRVPVYVHPEPAPMQVYAYTAAPEPSPEPERKRSCTHKRMRISKGVCPDFQDWVSRTS